MSVLVDDAINVPTTPRMTLRETLRRHPTMILGGTVLTLLILMAIFAPLLTSLDPNALRPPRRLRWPNAEYWFGTDMIGRDIYSRILYGARVSLIVGFGVAICSTLVGLFIGLVAGFNRTADAVIMRVMDGLMAIPPILLAIALTALTRASIENVIVAITMAEVPRVVRLVRSVVLSLRVQPFV